MLPTVANLFAPSSSPSPEGEVSDTLWKNESVRVERILSRGDASLPGFWYDQDHDEWVTLLCGEATLEFEDCALDLTAGDHLLIPARVRHRVGQTSADALWLAVHAGREAGGSEKG